MASKPHTFPESAVIMTSFQFMPDSDKGAMLSARRDLAQMKNMRKEKTAVARSNAYRVFRSENRIAVEFLDSTQPEEKWVQFRWIYQIAAGFA